MYYQLSYFELIEKNKSTSFLGFYIYAVSPGLGCQLCQVMAGFVLCKITYCHNLSSSNNLTAPPYEKKGLRYFAHTKHTCITDSIT